MRAVTHAFALGLYRWVPTEGSCNGFFHVLFTQPSGRVSFSLYRLNPRKTACVHHPARAPRLSARHWVR